MNRPTIYDVSEPPMIRGRILQVVNMIKTSGLHLGLNSDQFSLLSSSFPDFGEVTCAAEHLSLLALLLMPFACSNAAAIFSQQGPESSSGPRCRHRG